MKPQRSARARLERLDYLGDLLAEMTEMAASDEHRLLCYILSNACFEVDSLKASLGHEVSFDQQKHRAS